MSCEEKYSSNFDKLLRRKILKKIAFIPFFSIPSFSFSKMNEAQKKLLTTLDVTPWMIIRQSSSREVKAEMQKIVSMSNGVNFDSDTSGLTGGVSMTASKPVGDLLSNEKGLQIISLHFDPRDKLELVMFVFQRGWQDENVEKIKKKLDSKYSQYETGKWVNDQESDALDKYYIFDIGNFVVEFSVPQHGTFLTVSFTTKETHKKMHLADATYEIFEPIFEN